MSGRHPPRLFDAHLDLAGNAMWFGRDQTLPLEELRERETAVHEAEASLAGTPAAGQRGTATVTLPELRAARVRVVLATLLARCKPWVPSERTLRRASSDWPTPDMAYAAAMAQLAYYQRLEKRGEITILRSAKDLDAAWNQPERDSYPLGVILTLEGADPILTPEQLPHWKKLGLRTLMLAHFGKSRYSHGTPSTDGSNSHDVPGGLTQAGQRLVDEMARLRMPLDLSHSCDEAIAECLDRLPPSHPAYASHSTLRSVVPGNEGVHPQRMLSDEQATAIFERGGVVGLPLFNPYLKPGLTEATSPGSTTLGDVVRNLDALCQLAGNPRQVGLGSDLDGGFGNEHTPLEVRRYRDLPQLAEALSDAGYDDAATTGFLGGNWYRYWHGNL